MTRLYRSLCLAVANRALARGLLKWLLVPLIGILGLAANAQVIDQIELLPNGDSEKEIVLKFYSDVVLARYSPEREGQTLRIYMTLVEQPGAIASLPREVRTGPIIPGVPKFTVSFPEADGSLSIAFASPVKFRIRQVRGSRTISVFVAVAGGGAERAQQGVARGQVFEPKAVPGIPDVSYDQPAGRSFEPKAVAAFPDVVAAEPSKAQAAAAATQAVAPVAVAGPTASTAAAPTTAVAPAPAAKAAAAAPAPSPAPTVATQAVAAAPAATPSVAVAPSPQAAPTPSLADAAAASKEPLVLPEPTDEFPPVPLAQVEGVSKELLDKAKQALATNNAGAAIRDLNHLLSLPTNASTREAQELMGVAREKNNEMAKAKGEYELFLKLYPVGPDADRVRERLAKLPVVIQQPGTPTITASPQGQQPSWIVTGGLSQYLYRGNSHIEILTPPPPGLLTFNQQTLSLTDQNSLVTNLDVMALHRSDGVDTRIVFRDSYNKNYLTSSLSNQNRISAAYVEQNYQGLGIQYRVGRQSGTFGLVGMFDGAYGAYQFTPGYRVSALAGKMAQFGQSLFDQYYYGVGVEKLPKFESVGGTLYLLQDRADGYVNREALGLELRYFDAYKSAFAMADYDVLFKDLNLVMLQGNFRLDSGTSFFVLTDHRRSPMLQLTSALPAATTAAPDYVPAYNITQALLNTGISLSDLRQWAKDSTATSHLTSFGVSQPITQQWQVGADFGFSSMSATTGAGSIPAQPASGVSRTSNFQVIGSGVFSTADTMVGNVTLIDAPTYTGRNWNLNAGNSWFDYKLRIDLGWRRYDQRDKSSSATLWRTSPTFRISYRAFKDVTIEAEAGQEKSHQIDASGNTTDSLRKYLYTGYRWSWY